MLRIAISTPGASNASVIRTAGFGCSLATSDNTTIESTIPAQPSMSRAFDDTPASRRAKNVTAAM